MSSSRSHCNREKRVFSHLHKNDIYLIDIIKRFFFLFTNFRILFLLNNIHLIYIVCLSILFFPIHLTQKSTVSTFVIPLLMLFMANIQFLIISLPMCSPFSSFAQCSIFKIQIENVKYF